MTLSTVLAVVAVACVRVVIARALRFITSDRWTSLRRVRHYGGHRGLVLDHRELYPRCDPQLERTAYARLKH